MNPPQTIEQISKRLEQMRAVTQAVMTHGFTAVSRMTSLPDAPPDAPLDALPAALPDAPGAPARPAPPAEVPVVTACLTELAESDEAHAQANLLDQCLPAATVQQVLGNDYHSIVDSSGCMNYIEKVREEAGASSDPIEKMLIDHLTWANVTLARLHAKAANEKSPKLSQHYASLAIQWMAQIGKSAVVLQQYRLATAKLAALTRRGVEPAVGSSLRQVPQQAHRQLSQRRGSVPETGRNQADLAPLWQAVDKKLLLEEELYLDDLHERMACVLDDTYT